jgi:hypothetical protein
MHSVKEIDVAGNHPYFMFELVQATRDLLPQNKLKSWVTGSNHDTDIPAVTRIFMLARRLSDNENVIEKAALPGFGQRSRKQEAC